MRRSARGSIWRVLVAGLWFVGCGNGDDDKCTPGSEQCECAVGGLCLQGLSCFSNVCVMSPQTTNEPTIPPMTAGGSTTATSTDPDPTTGEPPPGCSQGYTQCGDACVDLSGDAAHCGECDNPCAMGEVCQDSQCATVMNCEPMSCPGLSYCSLETKQCVPGCQFSAQCGTNEACDTIAHVCVCAEGFREVNGVCVACDTGDACGKDCKVCPPIPDGQPACVNGYCSLTCNPGFQECDGKCHVDSPPICDENRDTCTPCKDPEHGTVQCVGDFSECTPVCDPPYIVCGDDCLLGKGAYCTNDDQCCGICEYDPQVQYSRCFTF